MAGEMKKHEAAGVVRGGRDAMGGPVHKWLRKFLMKEEDESGGRRKALVGGGRVGGVVEGR